MPIHLPHFGSDHKNKDDHSGHGSSSSSHSIGENERPKPPPSISSSGSSKPSSILRHVDSDKSSSHQSSSSRSGSFSPLDSRISSLAINREDTMSSTTSTTTDYNSHSHSTPGTSVSSLGQCPLPPSSASNRFPFFLVTLSSVSTLQCIALPLSMRPAVLDAINRSWKRGVSKVHSVDYAPELMRKHVDKGCDSGVWEVVLKGDAWVPRSEDRVSSKRILINLMTEFAKDGYSLASSFRTSAKDSGKDTMTFSIGVPDPNPEFFCVAFYSSDRIWIIDADAEVGEALEKGISEWWTDGIRAARVRERHCREITLKGTPWTSHHSSALISARCIHLVIMHLVTQHVGGYEFVGSVDMSDKEEGQMPATFYRRRR